MNLSSVSGYAEPDCVFVTPASPHDAIWYVTRHDGEAGYVEILKITSELTACKLTIELRATAEGCEATVTYAHTSLGPAGDRFVEEFTQEHYDELMRDWETRLNHYLRTGELLPERELHDGTTTRSPRSAKSTR